MIVHAAPWVVPVLAPPIRDGAVALDGVRVVAVGPRAALRDRGPMVEHAGVLAPGVVNAHTHLELSHLRVPGGEGLVPWIERLMAQRAQAGDGGAAAKVAAQAMAARGTVAAVDHANGDGMAACWAAAGIEAQVLHERIAPHGVPDGIGSEDTAHATYSCGAAALRAVAAATGGRLRSIHVEEDAAEAAWLCDGTGPLADFLRRRQAERPIPGRRPVVWLEELGLLGPGTLLVHLTVADDEELALAALRGCIAVLCPRSNLHIGGRLPSVTRLRAAGLRVALGTDSLASCPTLDVWGEVQTLARAGAEPAWLLAAVAEGGAAAVASPLLGGLAVGRCPGLVSFGDDAGGLADPVAWLVHEAADAPARRVA